MILWCRGLHLLSGEMGGNIPIVALQTHGGLDRTILSIADSYSSQTWRYLCLETASEDICLTFELSFSFGKCGVLVLMINTVLW
jgi:hypothetical protein